MLPIPLLLYFRFVCFSRGLFCFGSRLVQAGLRGLMTVIKTKARLLLYDMVSGWDSIVAI